MLLMGGIAWCVRVGMRGWGGGGEFDGGARWLLFGTIPRLLRKGLFPYASFVTIPRLPCRADVHVCLSQEQ